MSKQLKLSASLSVLAMFGVVLTGGSSMAGELAAVSTPIHTLASACTSSVGSALLPVLQPALQ